MKIIFISDTHGFHRKLKLPSGDMIIHAGDISNKGSRKEIEDFLDWFRELDFEHKIFIAGNHDFFLEEIIAYELETFIPPGIIYLNDSGVKINDINIWGSPIQPWFHDWAFNKRRGEEIKKHWDLIPEKTDILITHGPPLHILDKTTQGENVGCEDLLNKVKLIKPKIHVFGHIHEAQGVKDLQGITFINASVLDVQYNLVNPPLELEY